MDSLLHFQNTLSMQVEKNIANGLVDGETPTVKDIVVVLVAVFVLVALLRIAFIMFHI